MAGSWKTAAWAWPSFIQDFYLTLLQMENFYHGVQVWLIETRATIFEIKHKLN